jgi:hypothetical protein
MTMIRHPHETADFHIDDIQKGIMIERSNNGIPRHPLCGDKGKSNSMTLHQKIEFATGK